MRLLPRCNQGLRRAAGLVAACALAACVAEQDGPTTPQVRLTPVTVGSAERRDVAVFEASVGRLETPAAPQVAAETAGRVRDIRVSDGARVEPGTVLAILDNELQRIQRNSAAAELERLEALLTNQTATVRRLGDLLADNSAAQSMYDEAEAQQRALQAQIKDARAKLEDANYQLEKTRIISPIAATVQRKLISVGDYVAVGQPLFELVESRRLHAYLPFPETVVGKVQPGQPAAMSLPGRVESEVLTGTVTDIRPVVGSRSKAIEAIVEFDNPGDWLPGGSVLGVVTIAERPGALVVPELAVVRRPAGEVVYEIKDNVAVARRVLLGERRDGWVEVTDGLEPGTVVALDGAGFLTDGAPVRVRSDAG